MADEFSQQILIRVTAQICQLIGFDKIMTSALYTLTDILKDFILDLAILARKYGEHCGRSFVMLEDLSLAFNDFGVYPTELVNFLQAISPLPQTLRVPKYPVALERNSPYEESHKKENINNEEPVTMREALKIKISLTKIKEANKLKKVRFLKNKIKKKNKQKRKWKKKKK